MCEREIHPDTRIHTDAHTQKHIHMRGNDQAAAGPYITACALDPRLNIYYLAQRCWLVPPRDCLNTSSYVT